MSDRSTSPVYDEYRTHTFIQTIGAETMLVVDDSLSTKRRRDGRKDLYLTPESATAIRNALDAYIAAEAAEASKLKRGDVVRLKTNPTWIYTVTADEDTDGRVDLVCLARWGEPAGDFVNDRAEGFERIPA